MKEVYISIGGNLGDKRENLRNALIKIHENKNIILTKISSFYETDPWGKTDQQPFLNAAAKILTNLSPEDLLKTLQNIEKEMGRVRKEHWGERIIDIDIVHYEGVSVKSENLTLPHPYFGKRKFVLAPLFEIAPNLIIEDAAVKDYLKNCKDGLSVKKTSGSPKDFNMTIVAAMDKSRGIGCQNKLLYKIKSDMIFFRENTLNGVIIVGKNTFNEMRKLDKRRIIVLSKSENFVGENLYTAHSVSELFNLLDKFNEKIFVAGGEAIYNLLMPYARTALITHIFDAKKADKFFPPLYDFSLKEMRFSEENKIKFAFSRYAKKENHPFD